MEMLPLLILLIPFLTFSFLGMPIFISMGISSFIYILTFHQNIPLLVIPTNMIGMLDSYGYLAIPFFFLAGDLMNTGGITKRLVDFAAALVGHIKGGLSHVSIIANMIMAGVSGSAIADASATGSVLIPAMKKDGYPAAYAAAVVAAAATIGPIIPPSIPMVIYGLLVNVSIGKLFLAGAVPGFLMGLYLIITSYLISKKRNFPAQAQGHLSADGVGASSVLFCDPDAPDHHPRYCSGNRDSHGGGSRSGLLRAVRRAFYLPGTCIGRSFRRFSGNR